MRSPKLIIFDCDGVLVDSEIIGHRLGVAETARLGIHLTEEESIELFTGISDVEMQRRLQERSPHTVPDDFLYDLEHKIIERFPHDLQAIVHMEIVLQYLSQIKVNRCVASNSMRDRLHKALSVTGIESYFDEGNIYSVDVVAHAKPAPDLFLHAARRANVLPEDCLVVEDSPTGIHAARAANMPVIGFLGGTHAQNAWYQGEIRSAAPTKIVDDATVLLDLLQDLFGV